MLVRLLKALALQIGNQVSYNELGQIVGIDPKTVEKYIDILEKSYMVFRIGAFSRNLRNELKMSLKCIIKNAAPDIQTWRTFIIFVVEKR